MLIIDAGTGAIELHEGASDLDLAVAAWLHAKRRRSGSTKTLTAYRDTLASFRACLAAAGLDLDGNPKALTLAAQGWAGLRADGTPAEVTPATYNQRLAVISSFYRFAARRGLLVTANPVAGVERAKVEHYATAQPLDARDVTRQLKAIDRATPAGQRDHALLSLALVTMRRLKELASLEWRDVRLSDAGIATVTFRRAKGGKVMRDTLPAGVSRTLLAWLHAWYGAELGSLAPDAPLWPSLARNPAHRGRAIGVDAIADICEARLGTSKVHTLRHTGARLMEDSGAKVSDIQAKLGHESLATTGKYLAALKREENPHADEMARRLGLD